MSFGKTQATSLIPRNFSIFCDNNVFDVLQLYFELLFLKSIVAITKLLNIAQNCENWHRIMNSAYILLTADNANRVISKNVERQWNIV